MIFDKIKSQIDESHRISTVMF